MAVVVMAALVEEDTVLAAEDTVAETLDMEEVEQDMAVVAEGVAAEEVEEDMVGIRRIEVTGEVLI